MNFSSAFRYPFQNFAKVFSIVLAMTIVVAVFLGLILNSYDWSPLLSAVEGIGQAEHSFDDLQPLGGTTLFGLFGTVVAAIVSGFWLSGYSIAVIGAVSSGVETLPDVDFARNLKDGFYLFVSSLAYWLLFVVNLALAILILNVTASLGAINALVFLAIALFTVVAMCVMGWAYFVGMARFAAGGDHRAAWQIRDNIKIARREWRVGGTLLLYLIAFTLVYGIFRGIVDGLFGGISGMIGWTISIVIYYVFNLMQHFSTQHLIAQYAVKIGIGPSIHNVEKDKMESI